MKKVLSKTHILLIVFICIVFIDLFANFDLVFSQPASETQPVNTPSPTPTIGAPLFIMIPNINLHANVEAVGLDDEQKMANPLSENNAAWFNRGDKPGEIGTAVISGHYDTTTGSPSVFYELSKLHIGDEVHTFDTNGNRFIYRVNRIERYKNEEFPIDEVFGSFPGESYLNLITCEGTFDRLAQNYTHRTVVFTTLKQEVGEFTQEN